MDFLINIICAKSELLIEINTSISMFGFDSFGEKIAEYIPSETLEREMISLVIKSIGLMDHSLN